MTPASDSPILPAPHRIAGCGTVRVAGTGHLRIELDAGATVTARLASGTPYTFAGRAAVRVPSSNERIWAAAEGVLELDGTVEHLEIRGATRVFLVGAFTGSTDGRGSLAGSDGAAWPWASAHRGFRVDGRVLTVGESFRRGAA
ncbi:MAG: hypothetical protein IT460_10875 [Planctomycetes bacterium]|nr:hypothetical protein [Planctomycetota bacterium]